jgi:hypothetical protein
VIRDRIDFLSTSPTTVAIAALSGGIMPKPIRRVVSGHDAAGRSIFIMDASAPHVYRRTPGSAVVTELWETRSMPADNGGNAEVTDHAFRLAPPTNGTVFRVIEYPPDRQRLAALERERASADDGPATALHSIVAHRATPAFTRPIRSIMPSYSPAKSTR